MSIERINELQAVTKHWKESLTPPADFTPQNEYDRAQQENQELAEAIGHYTAHQTPQTAREVAQEAADVIIGMLGVISSVGYDAEGLLDEKLDIMFRKYSPVRNRQL